jgi:hypothetical protein
VLLGLFFVSRRPFVLAAAVLWACYVPYEYAMKLRILCTGECDIRIDLLLIYQPVAKVFDGSWDSRNLTELADFRGVPMAETRPQLSPRAAIPCWPSRHWLPWRSRSGP